MSQAERQSAADFIPEGWEVVPFSQFVAIRRGHDLTAQQRQSGSIPVMGSAGLNGFHDTAIQAGPGVVLGRSGASYGQAHWCETDFWPHNTALYVTDFLGSDPRFAFYLLRATDFSQHNSGGAQQSLNRNFIAGMLLARPPRPEQELIRRCLDDAEAVVTGLERLIAKKRLIKQGAMQDLLTARRRLPGFSGVWSPVNLAQESHLRARIGWQGLTTSEYRESGEHFLVTGTEIVDGRVDWRRCVFVDKWRYDQDRNIQLRDGDVLLTKDGTIGKVARIRDMPGPAALNSGVFVIRPKVEAYDPGFLFHVLRSSIFNDFLTKLTAGSTIVHLYQKDLVTFAFLAPEMPEQVAISAVLSDMDDEIEALEARLTKARAVKEGMMQNLLTGRVRLV